MTLQQLEYIVALANHQHFTRAAESCHVTQATLSAMVKKLEEELDVILFDRKSHPVIPTTEGLGIIEQARKLLKERDHILQLSEKEITFSGLVRIGVIPTIANTLLPKVLKPITTTFPALQLDIREVTTDEIVRLLRNETLDMGILATPLNDDTLVEEIMYYETMLVYGIEDDQKRYILPEEMKDSTIWLLEEGHCMRNQSLTICDIQEKTNPLNIRFDGSSLDTLISLSDQFGGFTLVPELYYLSLPKSKKAKVRYFEKPLPVREISIVHYRPFARLRIIQALAKLITETVSKELITHNMHAKDLDIIGI